MKCFDYEDMPDAELRSWLLSIKKDIESRLGFRNVKELQSGAIVTAIKRLDELRQTTSAVVAEDVPMSEIMRRFDASL